MNFLRGRVFGFLMAVLVILIAYGIWSNQNILHDLERKDALLGKELDAALQKGRMLRKVVETERGEIEEQVEREAVERAIVEIRGLPFLHPVSYEVMPREKLKEFLMAKIRQQYSREEMRYYEEALKRVGLLPRDIRLVDVVVELLMEQVAAFYDQDSHKLHTFEGWSLRDDTQRMVLAHELVHGLQDQHFHLDQLPLRVKDNDDASLASQSLLEGDATWQMGIYLQKYYRKSDSMKDAPGISSQNMEKFSKVPRFLRDTLTFPYDEGLNFITEIHSKGGNKAIDRALRSPPQSTEQILHPEKYLGPEKDSPQRVEISGKIPSRWKVRHRNVVGEAGIRMLFSDFPGERRAIRVAAGWGGDRLVLYEGSPDQWLLIWKTRWDTAQDAREFFDALEEFYRHRFEVDENKEGGGTEKGKGPSADSVFFHYSRQKQNITLRNKTVWFMDAPDLKTMNVLLGELEEVSKP